MSHTGSSKSYDDLQKFIYAYLGLHFPENKRYLLENGLKVRLSAISCETYEDYYLYLKFDPNRNTELVELANCLTTNETFFFRDQSQIDCLRLHLIPEIASSHQRQKRIRIWSAGCSTGEEPYTVAILLQEYFPELAGWQIEIIATDVNEAVLAKAKSGRYDDYAVRNISPSLLKKYFRLSDGQYEVEACIRKRVTFLKLNLFDLGQIKNMHDMDLVLCRNVLIYFDECGRKQIIGGFYEALRVNCALMIGFSETLPPGVLLFEAKPWKRTMMYYKPGHRAEMTSNAEMTVGRG